MNIKRSKLILTVLAYIYGPAAYFGVYLPFIVPSLDQWRQIPLWIPTILAVGFICVLVNLGMRSSTTGNVLHAILIHVINLLFSFLTAKLRMPGFKKWEIGIPGPAAGRAGWVIIEDLAIIVLPMVFIFAVAQGGRVLLGRRHGNS